jgi:hypothetical protein
MIDYLPRVLKNHRTCCDPSPGLRKKNPKNQVMEPTLNCQLFAGSLMKPAGSLKISQNPEHLKGFFYFEIF